MNTLLDGSLSQRAAAAVDRATGLALQADSASAAKILAGIPDGVLAGEAAAFRACMIERFGSSAGALPDVGIEDAWVGTLVAAYLGYWQQALTEPTALASAEAELQRAVGALLARPLTEGDQLDQAEPEIQAELAKRELHALLGRTAPLRELMLWKKQFVASKRVQLPEGTYSVTITYLDDFVLRGWGHYATCGRRSAAGWATDAGLFAVVPAYTRLDDETFSVRFLAHETQHFADKQAFGDLEAWELEYRAKLAELALAHTTLAGTLKQICENRSERSKQSPHAYANFAVIHDLEQRLAGNPGYYALAEGKLADEEAVRDAARTLLIEDSRRRMTS
jgi:hypothetical protein